MISEISEYRKRCLSFGDIRHFQQPSADCREATRECRWNSEADFHVYFVDAQLNGDHIFIHVSIRLRLATLMELVGTGRIKQLILNLIIIN